MTFDLAGRCRLRGINQRQRLYVGFASKDGGTPLPPACKWRAAYRVVHTVRRRLFPPNPRQCSDSPSGEDNWRVRIFIGRDGNEKRRYINKTIRGKKKDAQDYLNKTLTAISAGTFVEPSPMTVSAYFDKWLVATRGRVREKTFRSYEDVLRLYVRPAIGEKRLMDVRPLDLQSLYSHMQATKLKDKEAPQPGVIYGLGLSARTIRYAHTVSFNAFRQAVKWHMLARNPCEAVEPPRKVGKEMQALSPDEATRFLEAATPDRFGVLFELALCTGMRPSEYLGLQWKDVDMEKGIITVQRTLTWRKGGGWYFDEPKTPRSRRNIPLPATALRALKEHKRQQAEARMKVGAAYQNNDLVFATGDGTPLLLRNLIRRHFRPVLKRAKLPLTLRLYDLRHTCATLLLSAGVHPKVASERLGHSSVMLTMDVYSHVLPSMQEAATEKLESILFKQTGTQ
jgi:integrase